MDVRTQMRSAARCNARREAVAAGDRRLTFTTAWERGVRLANGLLALGLKPQDRVGVLEDNTLESADFFWGRRSPIWCGCRSIRAMPARATSTCWAIPAAGRLWLRKNT